MWDSSRSGWKGFQICKSTFVLEKNRCCSTNCDFLQISQRSLPGRPTDHSLPLQGFHRVRIQMSERMSCVGWSSSMFLSKFRLAMCLVCLLHSEMRQANSSWQKKSKSERPKTGLIDVSTKILFVQRNVAVFLAFAKFAKHGKAKAGA